MAKSKVILTFDGEYLGQHIGVNPMVSMAFEAVCPVQEKVLSTFSCNIKPFEGAEESEDTISFFKKKNPLAWDAFQHNRLDPVVAIKQFMDWVESFDVDEVWICASPGSVDKAFLKWYIDEFCPERVENSYKSPFVVFDYCIRSEQAGLLGINREDFNPHKDLPAELKSPLAHPHIASDDVKNLTDELLRVYAWRRKYKHIYDQLPKK